jgi:hypothetical protein
MISLSRAKLGRPLAALLLAATMVTAQTPQPPFTRGMVERVDITRRIVTIRTKTGPFTFQLPESAFIYNGADKLTIDRLRTNQYVAVRFHLDAQQIPIIERLKISQPELPPIQPPQPGEDFTQHIIPATNSAAQTPASTP